MPRRKMDDDDRDEKTIITFKRTVLRKIFAAVRVTDEYRALLRYGYS